MAHPMGNRSDLDVARLTSRLCRPPRTWASVDVFDELMSTNALAMVRGQVWAVVVAEHQFSGRGRLDRRWFAPAFTALTFSVSVPVPPGATGWVPLVAGLAVAEAVLTVTGLPAELKWPNDVLLPADDHRKVAGILCEYRPPADGADELIVIGVGLNVSQTRDQLPVDTGTSLTLAGAEPVDREDLLVTVLDRIAVRYAALQAGGAAADGVRAAYRAACSTLGTEVRLERPGAGTSTAHALDIDADGALVVDEGSGPTRYAAGDVTHVRPASGGGGLA